MDDSRVRLRLWSEEDFVHSQAKWDALLARSTADPLFMSWDWQWRWWHHHVSTLHGELVLLAGYSAEGLLVGIAPLYLRCARHRWPLQAMRLESIGSAWRTRESVFSEYLDFVVDHDYIAAFSQAVSEYLLHERRWSDLVIANTRRDSVAAQMVRTYLGKSCYIREMDRLTAHVTTLTPQFEEYVQALSPSVRRKLWNKRNKLQGVSFTLASAKNLRMLFDLLDLYHHQRWGARHYRGIRGHFHLGLATALAEQGKLRMSCLRVSDQPVSVMYNVRIGATEYNIQSGFDEGMSGGGSSPGYLHFGFCLEHASQEGVRLFDFLAGRGRTRDYKQDFQTECTELVTYQAVRSSAIAWLYRRYDQHVGDRPLHS